MIGGRTSRAKKRPRLAGGTGLEVHNANVEHQTIEHIKPRTTGRALGRAVKPAHTNVQWHWTKGRGAMRSAEQEWRTLLTPRELEIARLVARGLSNKEIAQMLGTSPGTVKYQVHWVLLKLGVSKRGDLVLRRRA